MRCCFPILCVIKLTKEGLPSSCFLYLLQPLTPYSTACRRYYLFYPEPIPHLPSLAAQGLRSASNETLTEPPLPVNTAGLKLLRTRFNACVQRAVRFFCCPIMLRTGRTTAEIGTSPSLLLLPLYTATRTMDPPYTLSPPSPPHKLQYTATIYCCCLLLLPCHPCAASDH